MADCTNPNSNRPIGTFRLLDGTRYLKTSACDNRANSAVSHVINREMEYHKFVWRAPAETVGPVYIRATIVSTKKVFWTNVTSQIIRDFSRVTMGQYCHIQQYLDSEMANKQTGTTRLDNQATNSDQRTTTSSKSTSDYHETTRHQHLSNISTERMIISTHSVDSKAPHSCLLPIIFLVIVFSVKMTLL
ncbi:hypothetical protein CHS0354_022424 [Potamilus streckersoni]|uniref:Reelin domain-containing protein n=1 Tax=Potamilus streckersoni TaxID=2493646 RepID=A0AAE0W467_9BIVA|nr:hypothetical protein CHS0354_022424 [Potamilus streckersoni]